MKKVILANIALLITTTAFAQTNISESEKKIESINKQLTFYSNRINKLENIIASQQEQINNRSTSEGNYTPEIKITFNDGVTRESSKYFDVKKAMYIKIGNKVFVSTSIDILGPKYVDSDLTHITWSSFTMTLPIQRTEGNFKDKKSVTGVGNMPMDPFISKSIPIEAEIGTSLAKINWSDLRNMNTVCACNRIEISFLYDLKNL